MFHMKFFFCDKLIHSLDCYIMTTIWFTFWDEFEPNFGSYFAFLFFGAFEGPSPHTPRIFMAVCGGHCLVTRVQSVPVFFPDLRHCQNIDIDT